VATRELSPSETFSERMRAARTTAGISQVELVERLERLGYARLKRPAIIELEKGTRRVSVDEWLAISAALAVAPLYLITPFEDDQVINADAAEQGIFGPTAVLKVADRLVLTPREARRWIRGKEIYYDAPVDYWKQYYCTQVPPAYRYRLRQLAAYIRSQHATLGRWVLPPMEPPAEEAEHPMAVPGLSTPKDRDGNRKGYPAPLWTWWMFKEEDDDDQT
jgi:transcriptional regulator with XRE-family HTH domain